MIRNLKKRGSAAVEFALVLPVLLLLTLPIIDYTWYFITWQSTVEAAQHATRVGSKTALVDDPTDSAESAAYSSLVSSLPEYADRATISSEILNGDTVRVEITVPYNELTGYLDLPDTLYATHKMKVEEL